MQESLRHRDSVDPVAAKISRLNAPLRVREDALRHYQVGNAIAEILCAAAEAASSIPSAIRKSLALLCGHALRIDGR